MYSYFNKNIIYEIKFKSIYIIIGICIFNCVSSAENVDSNSNVSGNDELVDEYTKIENFEIYKANEEQVDRTQRNIDNNLVNKLLSLRIILFYNY